MEYSNEDAERLKRYTGTRFNRFFNEVLSTIQLLSKSEYQYTATRAKVLRQGNNALREIREEIDCYDITENASKRSTRTDEYDVN